MKTAADLKLAEVQLEEVKASGAEQLLCLQQERLWSEALASKLLRSDKKSTSDNKRLVSLVHRLERLPAVGAEVPGYLAADGSLARPTDTTR